MVAINKFLTASTDHTQLLVNSLIARLCILRTNILVVRKNDYVIRNSISPKHVMYYNIIMPIIEVINFTDGRV